MGTAGDNDEEIRTAILIQSKLLKDFTSYGWFIGVLVGIIGIC